jgi:MarR family transcriptional regulator, organic hydroperoxide resistance regulator
MSAYRRGNDDDFVRAEHNVRARVGDMDIDFAAMAAVSNVFRVASAIRNHMERTVLGSDGLSWTGFVALFVLWVSGDLESRRLAEECGVTKGTLTGIIGTLERRGLVARRGHPGDGRLVIVTLTPSGRRLIKRVFPKFNSQEAAVTGRLADDERRQLAHYLREILRAVESDDGGSTSLD